MVSQALAFVRAALLRRCDFTARVISSTCNPRVTLTLGGISEGRDLSHPEKVKSRGVPQLWIGWETGAGEGIRTLDPNLGKVVLYP